MQLFLEKKTIQLHIVIFKQKMLMCSFFILLPFKHEKLKNCKIQNLGYCVCMLT